MKGWIKLHRKIQENPLWNSETFTRGQAWIDLLLLANHEAGYIYIRNHKITIKRGQVGWSQNRLATRWKWSRTKVRKFLNDLEKEQQLKQHKSKSYTVITLLNYNEYQSKKQQENNSSTTERQQEDTNKNDKNVKNDKKCVPPTQKQVQNYFQKKGKMIDNDIPLEAEKFINHYEDQNWQKSNGHKITNWHRQAGTWQANYQQWNQERLKNSTNNQPKQIIV